LVCTRSLAVLGQVMIRNRVMVLNAIFNNISVISWLSVLLVGVSGAPGENHLQTLSHNVVLITPRHGRD